jgi:hypothetical protein
MLQNNQKDGNARICITEGPDFVNINIKSTVLSRLDLLLLLLSTLSPFFRLCLLLRLIMILSSQTQGH